MSGNSTTAKATFNVSKNYERTGGKREKKYLE